MTQATSTATPAPGRGRVLRLLASLVCALTAALVAAAAAGADPGDVVWRDFAQRVAGGADAYTAIAVSPAGRVCAVGSTAASSGAPIDVLVRTYAPSGSVLWRRVWTWPGRGDDTAAAVTLDRRGNCVVAGSSGADALLLKYSPGGYLQWVRRSHGGFIRASFRTVAVDGSGNVYAAGEAKPSSSNRRLLLRKYSPAGTLRWQRTLASDAGDASASALVVSGGDVYVTGYSATGAQTSTAVTAGYSSGGVRRWMRHYAAAPGDAARATGIAFAGGPVVSGFGGPAGGATHGFVVRYDAAGTPLWTAGDEGAGATDGRFEAVVADAAGVVVTGSRTLAGSSQMLTVRFDALGAVAWERVTPGAAGGSALCAVAGGVLAAGGTEAGFADRLSLAGAPLWLRALTPEGYDDFRTAAAQAAGSEYLYVAGSAARSAGGTAATLVRYRP